MTIRVLYPCFSTAPVTQLFGENPDLYPLTHGHNGVDFGIPTGTPIYAAHDGSIIRADMATLVAQLQALGQRNADSNPRCKNHWRVRPDNHAVIFEAWWNDATLTAVAIRNRLAAIFGVANTAITYATTQTAYGPLLTYTYNSVARLRLGVFAGANAAYQESQAAARQYLADNAATWEQS